MMLLWQQRNNNSRSKMLILGLLLLCAIHPSEMYEVIVNVAPEDCNSSSYFEPVSHVCKSCRPLQESSENRLSCRCGTGLHAEFNEQSKSYDCFNCNAVNYSSICSLESLVCDKYEFKGTNLKASTRSASKRSKSFRNGTKYTLKKKSNPSFKYLLC